MTEEKLDYFDYDINGERGKIAYRFWSDKTQAQEQRPPLVCAHGLNQNSRHFNELAKRLVRDFDLMVPDYPGRGLSDALTDKLRYSIINTYVPLFRAFLDALCPREAYWLGTSMGGLTGMVLASLPDSPIKKLVLNDVGPAIPVATMKLAASGGKSGPLRFASFQEALDKMGPYTANFGISHPAMREAYVRAGLREEADGTWHPDFDPGIYHYTRVQPERNSTGVPFWHYWETVKCPVLVLHGVNSTTLTPEIIAQMKETRPDIDVIDIPGTGHAPHLMDDAQAELIREWLLKG